VDFAADLDFVLRDAGGNATLSLGSDSTNCIYASRSAVANFTGRTRERLESIGIEKTAVIKTGALPQLRIGSRVKVTAPTHDLYGVQFDVRNSEPVDEGVLTRLYFADV